MKRTWHRHWPTPEHTLQEGRWPSALTPAPLSLATAVAGSTPAVNGIISGIHSLIWHSMAGSGVIRGPIPSRRPVKDTTEDGGACGVESLPHGEAAVPAGMGTHLKAVMSAGPLGAVSGPALYSLESRDAAVIRQPSCARWAPQLSLSCQGAACRGCWALEQLGSLPQLPRNTASPWVRQGKAVFGKGGCHLSSLDLMSRVENQREGWDYPGSLVLADY